MPPRWLGPEGAWPVSKQKIIGRDEILNNLRRDFATFGATLTPDPDGVAS
jgi:hypothetical protein